MVINHPEWEAGNNIQEAENKEMENPVNQENEEARYKALERSLAEVDQFEDFEKHDNTDLIYRQYDPIFLSSLDHYERFDLLGHSSWKTGRPSQWKSWLSTLNCVFQTTVVSGTLVGLVLGLVVYFDVNLADLCYSYRKRKDVPMYIERIKTVSGMVSGIIVQLWNLLICFLVFNWSVVKNANILSWNILAASIEGIYRLIIGIFAMTAADWSMYPSYAIFIFTNFFNSIKIAKHFRGQTRQVSKLVIKLSSQFLIGIPVAFFFIEWVNPLYKFLSPSKQVVLASFVPLIVIIPKMAVRKLVLSISFVNHPGTSVYLIIAMYTSLSLLYRMLQIQLGSLRLYLIVSVIFSIQGIIERISLPYIDYINHRLFSNEQTRTEFMTPRRKRLMADLYLLCMITEPVAIIVSCTSMAALQFLYGLDDNGRLYDIKKLARIATVRIVTAMAIEFAFNVISTKIETYHFNMPVIRVWIRKRRWLVFTLLLNAILTILCFSKVFYSALSSKDMFDGLLVCSGPFQKPYFKNSTF